MKKDWGCIPLRCSACRTMQHVGIEDLYTSWQKDIKRRQDLGLDRTGKFFTAVLRCYCGNSHKYSSPMYNYIFRLIFEEISGENTTE